METSKEIVQKAISDPGKIYGVPEAVLQDERLASDEKKMILHSWEQDEIALLRAADENMPQKDGKDKEGEILRRILKAEEMLEPDLKRETVREAVGVFKCADHLEAAIDDLQSNGFMYHELSVLANERAVAEKLGYCYNHVKEAEDDPEAPRTIFISKSTQGTMEGSVIGLPVYIAATTAAGITAASGGELQGTILAAATAGGVGAAIGVIIARIIARKYKRDIQKHLDKGGLLLWVNIRSPEMEKKAKKILKQHAARDVHVHEITLN